MDFEYIFKHKKFFIIVILIAVGASFYFSSVPEETTKFDVAYDIINQDDAEMNFAIKTAQSTLNNFENALLSNDTNLYFFALKVRYETANGGEHIWFSNIYIENNEYFGYVDNEPNNIDKIKYGDLLKIDKNNITDWQYYKNDTCYGGYTIQVFKGRMTEKEQEKAGMKNIVFANNFIIEN